MFKNPQQGDTLPPHLIKYNIPTLSPEWFEFRTVGNNEFEGGVGASEISAICDENEYQSALELYGNKVGNFPTQVILNQAIFRGQMLENYNLNIWQFTDERLNSHVINHYDWVRKGKKDEDLIRKVYHEKAYVVNPKYPWLFISLDGWAAPGTPKLYTGEVVESGFPVEAKMVSYFSAKQYKLGYPRAYVYQLHQQMLVTESNYGELAMFEDALNYKVYAFERDERIIEEIKQKSYDFWYNKVLPARQAWALSKQFESIGNTKGMERAEALIQKLEPWVQGGDAYLEAKLARYKETDKSMEGTREVLAVAESYDKVKNKINDLLDEKHLYRNKLVAEMVNNDVKIIKFGDKRKASLTANNRLNVKVK